MGENDKNCDSNDDDDSDSDGKGENDAGKLEGDNTIQGISSRAQLEQLLLDLSQGIKDAIEGKNFQQASLLQKDMDEKELLRKFFPSIEELEAELKQEKQKLDEAINEKRFAEAAGLNETIQTIEEKIE